MLGNAILDLERFQRIREALSRGDVDFALDLFNLAIDCKKKGAQRRSDRKVAIYLMESLLKESGYDAQARELARRIKGSSVNFDATLENQVFDLPKS